MTLYSRNGKVITPNYLEVAKALEGIKQDALIDGEPVTIGQDGVSHYRPSKQKTEWGFIERRLMEFLKSVVPTRKCG